LVSNLNFRTRVQHFRLNINDVKFNLMNDKLVRKVPYLLVLASLVVSFSSTAVIRFRLDFKAIPNEKSHNCCHPFLSNCQ
jgi:hypothetical protein